MVLVKTQTGQEVLKDRRGSLSSRQRSAFILFDGKRSTAEILAATAPMGITQDDVQSMMDQGLLVPVAGHAPGAAAAQAKRLDAAPAVDLDTPAPQGEGSGRSPQERYQAAYPIATELTAGLGLRGFRLNLAVEAVGGFEELAALAPRIREAVGAPKFQRLSKALFD